MADLHTPEAGDVYVMSHPSGFGTGAGPLTSGLRVTVEGVYEPGTPGIGHEGDDPTVVAVVDESRRCAFGLTQFTEWFTYQDGASE